MDHASRIPSVALLLLLVGSVLPAASAQTEGPSFPHGVASGDVRRRSAVLWTRLDHAGGVVLQVATDPSFPAGARSVKSAVASAKRDFVVKRRVGSLEPGTTYFYRFLPKGEGAASDVGTFRTPPVPSVPAAVRFTFSGASDGTLVDGLPAFGDFEVLDRAREEEGDFFVYLGDSISAESSFAPPATRLDEYRAKYRENRDVLALRDLLRSTPIYAAWDDGEVETGFDARTVDPQRLARGRKAFKQFMPVEAVDFAVGFLRTIRWGKDVELFLPDVRSFRTAGAEEACLADPFPTLPAELRLSLGLPAAPPLGCLEALNDPSRTILGAGQKAVLKARLLESTATFKLILTPAPISDLLLLPYDRWEGYRAERDEILSFLVDSGITGVVFLTTGLHWNLVTDVRRDLFTGALPVAKEISVGPIADVTFLDLLTSFAGDDAAAQILDLIGETVHPEFSDPDTSAYALVEVDSAKAAATVTLKDAAGAVLHATSLP